MLTGLNQKKLKRWLLLFFVALAVPTVILIQQSYSRLKWETFHQYQLMADELSQRIDQQFLQLVENEEQRPFTDYSFLNVAGQASASFLQRSPLSHFPVDTSIPGVIGYFQVDSAGSLMTPLVPQVIESSGSYGIDTKELAERVALQNQIRLVLSQNSLLKKTAASVSIMAQSEMLDSVTALEAESDAGINQYADERAKPSEEKSLELFAPSVTSSIQGQRAFDDLTNYSQAKKIKQKTKLGRVEDLSLTQRYEKKETGKVQSRSPAKETSRAVSKKRIRTETNVLPEPVDLKKDSPVVSLYNLAQIEQKKQNDVKPLRISTFESEIDPFEFSRLDNGDFILFRKVWRNDQRYIQGMLINQKVFLTRIVNSAFRATALSQMSDLLVSHQGNVLEAFSARSSRGYLSSTREVNTELLFQSRLSAPLSDLQLLFSITHLPAGPGAQLITWLSVILLFVLCAGFYLMYRLGVRQILLLNQQQDFVSSVSHELKTPLTSIRMYGEMLREGWADETRKKTYYDFIVDESERLTRLINNVLLMAKLTRNKQQAELKVWSVGALISAVESKVSTQIAAAGFKLQISCDEKAQQSRIRIDADWFNQIMINLVDNAVKFSARVDNKLIRLNCQRLTSGEIKFSVRDYGPGVQEQQMKKIFKLFYRTENELTRETVGTGIGLALVHQMTIGMNGRIDVINSNPGAEFSVSFGSV